MASLIQRINKLEKATTGMLTPDLWEEAKIISALMDKATCPPNPALKEEALKRIIENLKDTDPDNPCMPPRQYSDAGRFAQVGPGAVCRQ
jgi:hypothetical protein